MKKHVNKNALVTGGTSGIGLAIAKEIIAEGARVIITGRNKKTLDLVAKEISATGIVSDQSSIPDIDRLVVDVRDRFEKLDLLIVNAGLYSIQPFETVSEDVYDSVMNVNLKGVFFTVQKFVPLLNEGASVILVSSVGAFSTPATGHSVYSATKAAMNALARSISFELAPNGIRVNAVCPGPTATPIFGKLGLTEETLDEMALAIKNKIPAKRFGNPSDIAKLVSFISSDEGSFINGSEYVIDGGLTSAPIMS
jgi:NAD(P)-dependent dehydrogenase (short-subunit alcohol dehydrogenase family)